MASETDTPDLSPEQWEQLAAGIFRVVHEMGLQSSYTTEGVIDMKPLIWPVLQPILTEHHNAVVEACARRMCFGCELDWPVEMLDRLRCHVAPTTMKHACKAQAILALKVKEGQ